MQVSSPDVFVVVVVGRNEFYPADLLVAPTQDLRKRNDAALEESGMAVVEEEEEEREEEEAEEAGKQQRKALPRRAAAKYDYPECCFHLPCDCHQ